MLIDIENNYIRAVPSSPIHELFTYKIQKLLLTSKPTFTMFVVFSLSNITAN